MSEENRPNIINNKLDLEVFKYCVAEYSEFQFFDIKFIGDQGFRKFITIVKNEGNKIIARFTSYESDDYKGNEIGGKYCVYSKDKILLENARTLNDIIDESDICYMSNGGERALWVNRQYRSRGLARKVIELHKSFLNKNGYTKRIIEQDASGDSREGRSYWQHIGAKSENGLIYLEL